MTVVAGPSGETARAPGDAPRVSLCVPTYGRARFLRETVDSALAQTVTSLEVVVVDDCSPDETAEVMARVQDPRVRYVRNAERLGVPGNLNGAIERGRGEYLVLLEDHDLLEPTFLEETLAVFDRHPSVGFVATGLVTIDQDGRPRERYVEALGELVPGRRLLRRLLVRTDCPFSVTTIIRRSVTAGLTPLFDPRYWWYADQYLWLRLASRSDFGYVARPLLRFRTREAGHHLSGREWESLLCLSGLHDDNWHLLHPGGGVRLRRDRALYELGKLREVAVLRATKRKRGQPWTSEDEACVKRILTAAGRAGLHALDLVPSPLLRALRALRHWVHRRRRRLGPAVAV